MTNPTKRTLPALLLALAVVAGGCRGDEGADPAPDGGPAAVDDGPDEGTDDVAWSSPINEALGDVGEAVDEADHRARQIAVEDLTVACMAEEGFTYHPRPVGSETERARSDLSPAEFAATHGFGFTSTETASVSDDAVEDPNAALLAEMTPAERDAWHVALWGAAPAPAPSGDEPTPPQAPEEGGCADAAIAEVHGEETYDREAAAAFDPLLNEVASVYDQIRRDPRVVAAAEAYAECMADAGQPGYSVDGDGAPSATDAVLERLNAAVAASAASGDADAEESGARLAGGGELSDIPTDVLAELRAFEIELAVADVACRDAYEQVRREVTFEHESRWVEANRAELEAYRAAVYGESGR